MIQFFGQDGTELGSVEIVDGKAVASNDSVQSIVDSFEARGKPLSDFDSTFDGWSNGYLTARKSDKDGA